ncbi:hypothetical protein [Variovorax sp. DXTD-1]|uniref:hypothetical protein n=1 Tax=Variovorax sp. DXTD-1 TaxID=2495592 RepID=UPI000F89C918|nr:hypothetical protein [Variovorax sp. DXTD-1]RST54102.1 hypothetical protein EJI00_02960 [Variovorax sp. DXTD-1]
MTNKLIRIGATYTIPAVQYQPARPAYTSTETVYGRTTPAQAGGWVLAARQVFPTGSGMSGAYYVWEPLWMPAVPASQEVFSTTVSHPATPEVQGSGARRIDNPPLGWTSFARSITSIRSGVAGFSARQTNAGAAIGMSTSIDPTPGYSHITHGLLLSNSTVRNLRTGADLGSFTTSDLFQMVVAPSGITFTKNGSQIGTDPNSYVPGSRLFLSAVLYGALDYVDSPSLVEDPSGESLATFPKARALSADYDYSESLATFPKMQAESLEPEGGTAVFPKAQAFSSDTLNSGGSLATFPRASAYSYGGTLEVVPDSESYAQFPKAAAMSLLLVGGTGESLATFPKAFAISADYPYAESFAAFPKAEAYSWEGPADVAYMFDGVVFDVPLAGTSITQVDARDAFNFDIPMTGTASSLADVRDAFYFDVPLSIAGGLDLADMRDAFTFDLPLTTPGADLEVHAVNLDGFGSTTYSNYPFNSFARIGDRYYGAKLDGLFLLGGADDAGQPINAAICPGNLDFGSPQQKTISEAFIGAASKCPLKLKVAVPGSEFEYAAETHSDELKQHRFKLGKGLKANYLIPVFYNQDGSDFEVDSLEFEVADLSRKIRP